VVPVDRPRPHHYRFAHRRLPQIMLNPDVDPAAMDVSGRLHPALLASWAAVGGELAEADRLAPDGLAAARVRVDGREVVLVTLPPALGPAEAHFVALIGAADGTRRYFTLERSVAFDGRAATVLGEWAVAGHVNFGAGPAPDGPAFVGAALALAPGRRRLLRRWGRA
jgi:hypothetical protein